MEDLVRNILLKMNGSENGANLQFAKQTQPMRIREFERSENDRFKHQARQLSNDLVRFVNIFNQISSVRHPSEDQKLSLYLAAKEIGEKCDEFYQDLTVENARSIGQNDVVSYYLMQLTIIHDSTSELRKTITGEIINRVRKEIFNETDYKLVVKYCGLNPIFNWINSISDAIKGLDVDESEFEDYLQDKYF
jgi:hypothetical protein